MTKDELITKQQLEIEELKSVIRDFEQADANIDKILHCVGGPLNDNKLGYSKEQLGPFFKIREWLK